MNSKLTFSFISGAFVALAASGLVIKADPAIAQQPTEQVVEEIVVEAPIMRRHVKLATARGGRAEMIELRRRVGFSDLDLSKYADVTTLETRIEATAKEACEKLDEMFPLTGSAKDEIQRCTDKAVNSAQAQLLAAIATAN